MMKNPYIPRKLRSQDEASINYINSIFSIELIFSIYHQYFCHFSVSANSCRYFTLTIPDYTELIPPYTHINVQVRVLHGSLAGIYLSPDQRCPTAFAKVISQECFSACCSETCDRVYPTARNSEGGICVACMDPSRDWTSALPRIHSGGQASSTARAAKVRAVVTSDKSYTGDARANGEGTLPNDYRAIFRFQQTIGFNELHHALIIRFLCFPLPQVTRASPSR